MKATQVLHGLSAVGIFVTVGVAAGPFQGRSADILVQSYTHRSADRSEHSSRHRQPGHRDRTVEQ